MIVDGSGKMFEDRRKRDVDVRDNKRKECNKITNSAKSNNIKKKKR